MRLVLASASPRRQELLREAGIEFVVQPAHVVEEFEPGESPKSDPTQKPKLTRMMHIRVKVRLSPAIRGGPLSASDHAIAPSSEKARIVSIGSRIAIS